MLTLGGFLHSLNTRTTSLVWKISSCELCLLSHWEQWETWKYKSGVEYITEMVQYKSQADAHTLISTITLILWMRLHIIMQLLYWLINKRLLTWTFRINLLELSLAYIILFISPAFPTVVKVGYVFTAHCKSIKY